MAMNPEQPKDNKPSDTPRTDASEQSVDIGGRNEYTLKYVKVDFARTLERELNEAKDLLSQANWMLGKCSCGGNIVHEINEPFAECDKCHQFGEATTIPYPQQVAQLRADLKMCAEALKPFTGMHNCDDHCEELSMIHVMCVHVKAAKILSNPRIQAILNKKETNK